MFTGIVKEIGTVLSVKRANGVDRLSVLAPKTAPGVSIGESVAINGVCLSVVRAGSGGTWTRSSSASTRCWPMIRC